jgi:hypothetical protein
MAELATDLIEPAKGRALEKLGQGEIAMLIAKGWLWSKQEPKPAQTGHATDQQPIGV